MKDDLIYLVTLAPEGAHELDIASLMLDAGPVVKLVLITLFAMSVMSLTVIGLKLRQLNQAQAQTIAFLEVFWNAERISDVHARLPEFTQSPVALCFHKGEGEYKKIKQKRADRGLQVGDLEQIKRALEREQGAQRLSLLDRTSWLATIASLAPFIGLFGTVWGIMDAFLNIAQAGNASLTTVAPPIAEALIATAIGLFAAIPSVFGYNLSLNYVKRLQGEMETFTSDFLNLINRKA
jgi:biopolymer transport protein TolQ